MLTKMLISIMIVGFSVIEAQNKSEYFQIGVYGLQSPVGTKGFQTGKLDEIKNDISMVNGNINAAMAMRSWNREKYPNWNFEGFFINYMKDMYSLTNSNGNSGIQVVTPSLYGVFVDPIIDGTNENEKGFNRHLSREIFKKFVLKVLNEEFNIIKEKVKSEAKIIDILTDKTKRPLLGWYLDDEPLVRNHDITAIIEMGWYIRELEKEFYEKHKVLSKYPNKLNAYYQDRYIAFDGDDLHRHKKSGRADDGVFYNVNGKEIKFSNSQIYTVFPEDVVDVLLIDFYLSDPSFWKKIFNDVKREYRLTRRNKPKVVPVIFANTTYKYKSSYASDYYSKTFETLKGMDIDGLWIFTWNGNKEKIGAKDIWNSKEINLKKYVEAIE